MINKQLTVYLKGIAIILMVVHHSFGWPSWYIDTISYPELLPYVKVINRFAGFAVVPFFLFLSGYTYYLHIDKSYKYSFKKIILFLCDYWIVLFSFMGLACLYCQYTLSLTDVLKEMFAIKRDIMCFGWYVIMYIEIMLFLPFIDRTIERFGTKKTVVMLIMVFVLTKIFCRWLSYMGYRETFVFEALNRCFFKYMPITIIGYLSAKFGWLEKLYDKIKNWNQIKIVICLLFVIVGYHFVTKLNFLYVMVYIVLMSRVILELNEKVIQIVSFLGKHSMNIWFGHCLFFSKVTMEKFQEVAH